MRRVAFSAIVLLLLFIAANLHTANAQQGQTLATKTSVKALITKPAVVKKPVAKIVVADKSVISAVPAPATAPAPVIVTVQAGDTLSAIAGANNTTVDRLFDANVDIADPNVIVPGQQLRIPANDEQLTARDIPAAPAAITASATTSIAPARASVVTAVEPLPDDAAKAFIYSHESGNNPAARSASGCFGLGQDCNGVVEAQCGTDYACQDAYFTSYAVRRYGSWAGAAAFWQANGWW